MTKEERIEAELARMNEIYKDLPEDTLAILAPLIQNAAFMKVTLEDLQEEIRQRGATETYTNGANQQGRKQSAAVQAYNQTLKNYNNAIKTLAAKMPVVRIKEVVRNPYTMTLRERTEEERAAERAEEEARDARTRREIEEASRRQKEQWKREGRPGYT